MIEKYVEDATINYQIYVSTYELRKTVINYISFDSSTTSNLRFKMFEKNSIISSAEFIPSSSSKYTAFPTSCINFVAFGGNEFAKFTTFFDPLV